MKNIVIIGASGHGGMVLDCIQKEGLYNVLGFIDSFKKKRTKKYGLEVLGTELDLPTLSWKLDIQGAIVAIGNNCTRKRIVAKIKTIAPNLEMVKTVHPNAIIGMGVKIGKGTFIAAGAIVNPNSTLGDFCILNTNSSLGHDGIMKDFSSISSGVCTGGKLVLGKHSAISLGSNVIENIIVGENSVIGAGSLVINDIASHSVYYGSPARFVRIRKHSDAYLNGDFNFKKTFVI